MGLNGNIKTFMQVGRGFCMPVFSLRIVVNHIQLQVGYRQNVHSYQVYQAPQFFSVNKLGVACVEVNWRE